MKPATISEAAFQRNVVEIAHTCGWLVHHGRRAQLKDGTWTTPLGADKGFVDLVLVRHRVIFAELKTEAGRLSHEQVVWGDALMRAGATYYVWRPADLSDIINVLMNRGAQ